MWVDPRGAKNRDDVRPYGYYPADVDQEGTNPITYQALTSSQDGQRPKVFPLDRRGGHLRFAFGHRGMRSSLWKVQTTRSGEVYVMERTSARDMKISLHRSGDWRHAWISNNGALTPDGQAYVDRHHTRILDRWRRPAPMVGPITRGLTIEVTDKDVQPWPNDDAPAAVEWVNPPPAGPPGALFDPALAADIRGIHDPEQRGPRGHASSVW
jgi:hypothetical protein